MLQIKITLTLILSCLPILLHANNVPDPEHFLKLFNHYSPAFEESESTANAYYQAIDSLNARTTLSDFLTQNNFNPESAAHAVYLNKMDLGFGRDMYMWSFSDNIITRVASFVKNYGDSNPGGSVIESIDGDPQDILNNTISDQHLLATVAMEYSELTDATVFYAFDKNGQRINKVDLDGRGEKYLPGVCNVCHGGNPQPLDDSGGYPNNGHTNASFLPWDLNSFEYSTQAGLTRSDQESNFSYLNSLIFSTNPNHGVKDLLNGWYYANNNVFEDNGSDYIPNNWTDNDELYKGVVAKYCRACHITRNPAIDFNDESDLNTLIDRVYDMVFERRMMPLAKRTYDKFWSDSNAVNRLHSYSSPGLALNVGLLPPIAIAGVNVNTPMGASLKIDASNSLFYQNSEVDFLWADNNLLQNPIQTDSNFPLSAFLLPDTSALDLYSLEINNNSGLTFSSASLEANISQYGTSNLDPFAPILTIYNSYCNSCHDTVMNDPAPNFDEVLGSEINNNNAIYRSFSNRVNIQDPQNSLLLLKATNSISHGGGVRFNRNDIEYESFIQWIQYGALKTYRPVNDNIRNALEIKQLSGTAYGSNQGATPESSTNFSNIIISEPFNNYYPEGSDTVWWTWKAKSRGEFTINTMGSEIDTVMAIYTGKSNDLGKLTLLDINDDDFNGVNLSSQVSTPVVAGKQYFISVSSYNSSNKGNITLNWEGTALPPIMTPIYYLLL